jgi:hypothetical protein
MFLIDWFWGNEDIHTMGKVYGGDDSSDQNNVLNLDRKNTILNEDINLKYEKKFIENIPSTLNSSSEKYLKLMIALFLIMHETYKIEDVLNRPYIPHLNFKTIK